MLFDNVMRALWGDNDMLSDFIVKSVHDKVRGTARINPENALEVIDLFGPGYCTFMETRAPETDEVDTALFLIRFRDNSSILIEAKRGIGSSVEVL
jgi:hypothetical protein